MHINAGITVTWNIFSATFATLKVEVMNAGLLFVVKYFHSEVCTFTEVKPQND